jgi:hypothetical protein
MTRRDLGDARDILFRAYESNVMFLATLRYHLAQRRIGGREGASEDPQRSSRAAHRREDVRWLR